MTKKLQRLLFALTIAGFSLLSFAFVSPVHALSSGPDQPGTCDLRVLNLGGGVLACTDPAIAPFLQMAGKTTNDVKLGCYIIEAGQGSSATVTSTDCSKPPFNASFKTVKCANGVFVNGSQSQSSSELCKQNGGTPEEAAKGDLVVDTSSPNCFIAHDTGTYTTTPCTNAVRTAYDAKHKDEPMANGKCYSIKDEPNANKTPVAFGVDCGTVKNNLQLPTSATPVVYTGREPKADTCGDEAGGRKAVKISIDIGCKGVGNPIIDMLFAILRFMTVGVGLVVVASVIVGGIQFTTARGDPQATAKAVKRIASSIGALGFFLFIYAILNWLVPSGLF